MIVARQARRRTAVASAVSGGARRVISVAAAPEVDPPAASSGSNSGTAASSEAPTFSPGARVRWRRLVHPTARRRAPFGLPWRRRRLLTGRMRVGRGRAASLLALPASWATVSAALLRRRRMADAAAACSRRRASSLDLGGGSLLLRRLLQFERTLLSLRSHAGTLLGTTASRACGICELAQFVECITKSCRAPLTARRCAGA